MSGISQGIPGVFSTAFEATWITADGTSKTITHGLATTDLQIGVYDIASGATIMVDSEVRTDVNNVTLTASVAPPVGGWRVTILSAGGLFGGGTGTVTSVTGSGPISTSNPTTTPVISITKADASHDGYLAQGDWSTFNAKQPAGSYITALTSDVAASGPGSATATIQANVVTNSKLAQMPTLTLKGNNTGGTANALDLTVAQVNTMLGDVTTMSTFGSSPNANGATITGNNLALQPADGTHPGGVSTTTQTFGGSKTFGQNAADVMTIGAASSTAIHQTNGGQNRTTKTITAATYSVDATTTDYVIFTDSTSNAITITLPAPTNGRMLEIADITGKAGTNAITLNPHASEKINGLSTYVISRDYGSLILTSNGTDWLATAKPISGSSFLTSGTTYTTPTNVTPQTRFKFTLIGGGGGSGGINTTNGKSPGGGGGGGLILFITGLAANTGYTIAIGAGGTAGAATPTAGGNGGDTTLLIGATTYTAGGGKGGGSTVATNGGLGGGATNGSINIVGQAGGAVGAAGTQAVSGYGGSSPFGFGTGGLAIVSAGTGNSGGGYGAGAGGASGLAATGGAGTQGCILVEWAN